MKSLSVLCIVLAMLCSALAASEVDSQALLVRNRRSMDLAENTRKLIEQLAGNLRTAAQDSMAAVANFTSAISQEVNNIRQKILEDIQKFRNRVTEAIDNVVNKVSNTGSAVRECVDSHRSKAAAVFNQTSSETLSCVDRQVSEIGKQIEGLRTLAQGAIESGAEAIQDIKKCTRESPNILSTGSCLGVLAVQTEMKSAGHVAQSVVMIGRINLSIAALPASLEVCAGTQLVQAGIETGKIVVDIGTCSANAIFTAMTGNHLTQQ